MNNIENRLKKLESTLLKEKDTDFESMTLEQRQHRIAELIFKGLCDTDKEVMDMTESAFVSMYLSMNPEDREVQYDQPIYKQLKTKYE